MDHYFTNTDIKHNIQNHNVIINELSFTFKTDNGVFSKKGLDFGTRTLLQNLPLLKGDVLDFGCGYGPIGIYISKKYNIIPDMIDINKRSIDLTIANAKLNNVTVNAFVSDIYSNVNKKYDFIITNPPIRVGKKILYQILFEAINYLKPKGELWLVINKNQGAKSLEHDLSEKYSVNIIDKNKGFYIIKAKID